MGNSLALFTPQPLPTCRKDSTALCVLVRTSGSSHMGLYAETVFFSTGIVIQRCLCRGGIGGMEDESVLGSMRVYWGQILHVDRLFSFCYGWPWPAPSVSNIPEQCTTLPAEETNVATSIKTMPTENGSSRYLFNRLLFTAQSFTATSL